MKYNINLIVLPLDGNININIYFRKQPKLKRLCGAKG